jgi:hypothetical protein
MTITRAVLHGACLVLLASPALAQDDVPAGSGVQVGDRCYQGDPLPRPGLVCLPAFVTIDGFLHEEWEYETSYIFNARKGDAVLSAGCELIGNLLREVYPPQTYSHAGIMVEDRHKIRHSTASVDWLMEQRAGDPPGSEGLLEKALKHAWPGTITQWADDALEGAFVKGPVGDVFYEMKSFNPSPVQCGDDGQVIPDTILKPPPLVDADPASGARERLHLAADAAQSIDGHYRFFGYSQPVEVLYSSAVVPGNWADGTIGSVCSAFVWRSMKDAGFTLEGSTIESNDVAERGAAVDAQTPDGMYIYTAAERANAADFIYQTIGEQVAKQVNGFEDLIADISDDLGNQMVNCFGFDWCGETFSTFAGAAGCDPNDQRAQDSPCWLNEGPGIGRAVSPDNMLNWDIAPNGPYGYREDLAFAVGGYHRTYRWRAAEGTGTLQGVISDVGVQQAYAPVILDGFNIADFTDPTGFYKMEGVPAGAATVRTCTGDRGRSAIVSITADHTTTRNLALQQGCNQAPDPGKWRRKIRVQGTVKITDTEDFGSDEVNVWTFDESVTLEPNTTTSPNLAEVTFDGWTRCTGGEVRARVKFTARLNEHDRSAEVTLISRMYEGTSCDDDDLDSTTTKLLVVPEDGSKSVNYLMENEEFGGEDTIRVILTITNTIAPPS